MKKMLYVGHSYHQKTKSISFFLDILKKEYEITFISFDPYTNRYEGVEEAQKVIYDVLLAFQIMPEMDWLLSNFCFKQGVVVPMYDAVVTKGYDPWPEYREFKIISFSKTLHDELVRRGYKSYYIQYFPKPREVTNWGEKKSVFFWQRLEQININVVAKLLENIEVDHIHIHKSLDPNQKFVEPDNSLSEKLTYSEWFENPAEMHQIMQESALYIAPRLYEGIGMSFLEAMATGRCVVAPNYPTMNEYIINGVNGILYDVNDVKPVAIDDICQIQKNALAYIEKGYEEWEKNKENILKWIEEDDEQPLVTVVTVEKDVYKCGRADTFRQCIESVHNQIYPNVQHLVIDGASEDGTLNMLEKYSKLGWIEYFSEADTGMYEAMNKGIRMAKGKYIVFLNTDDYFHNPKAISESVYSLENSQADFSFASNRLLMETGVCDSIRKPEIGSFVAQMPFCHQTMFTKKDVLVEVGMFNEEYKSSADYDLVLRVILAGYKYVEVETDIVTYRRGGVSESQQQRADEEKRSVFKRLYSKYYDKSYSEEFACRLAGRICPFQLYDNLCASVSAKLRKEIENAVVRIDDANEVYYFPEEIVIPLEMNIVDGTSITGINKEKYAATKAREERLNKFISYFTLLDRWLWLKMQNKTISSYFEKQNYQTVGIYGMGEIGNRLYEELSRFTSIKVEYAIDKIKESHPAMPVYGMDDELPEVDVIVVSTNHIFEQVREQLSQKTDIPIVSINDVIFDVE